MNPKKVEEGGLSDLCTVRDNARLEVVSHPANPRVLDVNADKGNTDVSVASGNSGNVDALSGDVVGSDSMDVHHGKEGGH
jgi:hypothetical protein